MKVSQYKVGTRRFLAFVDKNEIPVYALANAFLYDEFFNASFSSKSRIAQELKVVLDYFAEISVDIEARVASGDFLTPAEISAFYNTMRLKKSSFKNTKKRVSGAVQVQSKMIRNAFAAAQHHSNKVDMQTTTGRVRTLRKYLAYLFNYYHGDRAPEKLARSFEIVISKIKSKERYTSAKVNASPVELVESVIPDKIYVRFLELIKPASKENPFRSSKLRNYLILSILNQTGIRRSEVCKIKISDFTTHDGYCSIKVYSTPDDPSDPRLIRPDKKVGRPHLSGIEPSLFKDVFFYINHVRKNKKRAHTHDFLFVSEKDTHNTEGLPLTREMINYMLAKLSAVLDYKIHPHLLRHKWNERLSEKGKAQGLDRDYLEDIRRSAMGWQPDSNMGRIYNDKHEQIAAIELMVEHQRKVDGIEE